MVKVIIKKFMFLYGKVIIDKRDRNYFKLFQKMNIFLVTITKEEIL